MDSDKSISPLKKDSPTMKIIAALSKVGIAVKSHSWKKASENGLTPTQGQILVQLDLWSNEELRLSELAEALGISLPTASNSISALEEKELIRKNRSSADGRSLDISLTAKGKQEALKAAGWPDFMIGAVGVLTPEEQNVFFRNLLKVIRALQEKNQIPVARMCVTCTYFQPNVYEDQKNPHHCAFVNAPFGDGDLRLECPEHESAPPVDSEKIWKVFRSGMK